MNQVTRRQLFRGSVALLTAPGLVSLSACAVTPAPLPASEASPVSTPASTVALAGVVQEGERFTLEVLTDFPPQYLEYTTGSIHPRLEEMHPGATVQYLPFDLTRLEEHLLVARAAGVMPDLFRLDETLLPRVANDELSLPLDERVAEWGVEDDFYPAALSCVRWKGRTWGLPQMVSPRHYCYRRDITEEAGVQIPDEWTWDDMLEAAIRLTVVEEGKVVRLGSSCPVDFREFWGALRAAGGRLIANGKPAFGDEAGLWALKWITQRNTALVPEGTAPLDESSIPHFAAGRWAIAYGHVGGHWADVRRYAPDKAALVSVPQPPLQERRVCPIDTGWLAMAATTRYAEAAWDYLKLHLEPEPLAVLNQGLAWVPPRRSAAETAEYMSDPVMRKTEQNLAQYGEPFEAIPEWRRFEWIIEQAIEAAVLGLGTPEEALADAAAQADRIMAGYPDWPRS
ncbi:MAG: extracellular solute-binding protein [Anaerolineae bacterium]|nr:extracellular solute-binding protein [Anaerolineae bacterium]